VATHITLQKSNLTGSENTQSEANLRANATAMHPDFSQTPEGWARWFDKAVFIAVAGVALCAPLSTKGAVNCFRAATVFWLILICAGKRKLCRQPLGLPLVFFLLFSGISTALSSEPLLSWGRMRTVTLLLLAVVMFQSLSSLRQLKILAGLLLGACLVSVIHTGWQYTFGIGVRPVGDRTLSVPLATLGLEPDDIIIRINGNSTRTPQQLFSLLDQMPAERGLQLLVSRGSPSKRVPMSSLRQDVLVRALRQPGIRLIVARPLRAEGFLKHYFPYSEVLVLAGLLCWGMCLAGGNSSLRLRIFLFMAFVAITAALALTLTRISLLSLFAGALLIALLRTGRKNAVVIVLVFTLIAALGMYWVGKHRALALFDASDPGTEYRLLMWRDSLNLIRAHPLFGVGLDSVAGDWRRWDLEAYRRFDLKSHFHSTPIQLAVECGLPALAIWFWLMGEYFAFLLRLRGKVRNVDWFAEGISSGVLGGLVAFLAIAMVQYDFGDAEAMVVFWFCMGLAFALQKIADSSAGETQMARN
jgi:O-antigen ligase